MLVVVSNYVYFKEDVLDLQAMNPMTKCCFISWLLFAGGIQLLDGTHPGQRFHELSDLHH